MLNDNGRPEHIIVKKIKESTVVTRHFITKTRFANHKTSFTNVKKKHATELSKHVWQLKDKHIDYKIKWEIIKQASPYNNTSNRCNLCLWEKYFIICHPSLATLNKRNELVSSCRHANKYLLRNFVT